jgi:hypothetical protein
MEHEIHIVDGIEMMDPSGPVAADPLAKLRAVMSAGNLDEVLREMRAAFELDIKRAAEGYNQRDPDLEGAAGRHFGSGD